MIRDMKTYIKLMFVLAALFIGAANELCAQAIPAGNIIINGGTKSGDDYIIKDGTATAGTIAVSVSERTVTLTITPAAGYMTKKGLILAERMLNPASSAPRRAPNLANKIEGEMYTSGTTTTITSVTNPNVADYVFTVPANYDGAYVTVTFVKVETDVTFITSLDEIDITNNASGYYKLSRDIDATGNTSITGFTGTLDGNDHKIFGITNPIFSTLTGGTVKNVTFEGVNINSGDNDGDAGAVCCKANGATRIYNCGVLPTNTSYTNGEITGFTGSSVIGTRYVGSLVGFLDGEARVINCFSYANVSGGTEVGGIVGHNNVATTSATDNQKTMVLNCMFYGEVSGTSIAPIYNGAIITNDGDANGVNNFNYFWAGASYVRNINVYNCALSAETRYLQRFEFFRHLLNSNRELAAWWVQGAGFEKKEMAKWVLEPKQIGSDVPFPILKPFGKYSSVVNIDADNATTTTERNKGGKLTSMGTNGELSVTISGATKRDDVSSLTFNLVITDKDPEHFNFNYGKVQLPYFNDYCTGNYTSTQVVTGWKITSITGGTSGSYTTDADATADSNGNITTTPYNFADRKCTNKDLYGEGGSNRVFNQGAYWDVPEGVTAITIQPYWGNARYVADACLDVVYKETTIKSNNKDVIDAMSTPSPVTTIGGGARYTNGTSHKFKDIDQNEHELTVYTSISEALSEWSPSGNVYDYALVLVGNVHNIGISSGDSGKPYTIMSVDFDHDNEPDYSYILRFNNRNAVHPVRVDFLNIPGLGMAQKTTGGKGTYNLGIMNPLGWFESTNTSLFYVTQFEYDHKNRTANPYILQGGVFDQWVSGQSNGISNNTTYFHVGGNVWFKEFHRGTHQDQTYKTKHPPVSVTGGDFNEFYLTGLYRGDVANYEDNAECYINGGRFGIVAGAAMEGIGKAGGANNTGNIIWQIQNADIDEFYGGGFNAAHPIEGNITTVITGGYIKQFCGGPKFGDMNIGKTVKTTANGGCIFDTFFGAGFGGNSYSRYAPQNKNNISGDYGTSNWNTWLNGQYTQQYSTNVNYKGVATTYSTQYLPMSNNIENVARLLIDYVSFSLATTRNVTSNLTDCTINKNFYGGGNLGMVDGPVTSTLTNCTVMGNVFGAGYSAELPTVEVRNTGNFVKAPFFDEDLGAYYDPEFPGSVEYKWEHVESVTSSNAIDKNRHRLRTQENLDALGVVKGKATLNIEGTTEVKGSVYGGGEESGVDNDTEIKVKGGIIGTEGQGGVEYGNVYGGGKGKRDDVTAGLVKGNTKVTISQEANQTTRIYHNVYGGGAYGSVGTFTYNGNNVITGHTANTGKTEVYIKGGTFGWNGKENGMVFGSSRGDVGAPEQIEDKLAWVYDTKVYIGTSESGSVFTTPTVMGSVYGGGENGHVYHDAEVNIYSGTVGIPTGSPITDNNGTPDDQSDDVPYSGATYPYRGNVYGSGCGTDKYYSNTTGVANLYDGNGDTYNPLAGIVQGNTTVNISGGHVVRNVYGAGAMGSVGTASDATSGKTTVTVRGGRIGYNGNSNNDGNIFGAARGEFGVSTAASGLAHVRETEVNISYTTTPTADDEDKTTQLITGSVFGGGEAGTVKGSVAVSMSGGLILKDIYGGGALADTQTSNWDASANSNAGGWADTNAKSTQHTTTVRATGGIVKEEIYGGALGEAGTQQNPTGKPAYVWGDVLVELNYGVADAAKGCVVGKVFGCNNANGTPKGDVMVHVYATQNAAATQIANTGGETPVTNAKRKGYYDVSAVYGGGNEAAYDPVTPNTSTTTVSNGSRTQVIIEGCDRTSIESVYGGGNAAAVPETNVDIKSAYEIYQVFGGGNGKDKRSDGSDNPGADVGTLDQGETAYGTGNANSLLEGGLIHEAYGGSNQKGIIKTSINQTTNPDGSTCNLNVEKIVGAGKYADIDGDVNMTLSCQPESKVNELFAGADEANVNGNITLTITNGHFGKVFGGNNLGGAIKGKITVNVEETGCQPIKIDNLYLGGNQAAYSVFGYYESDEVHDVTGLKILKPRTSEDDSHTPVDNPASDDTHTFPYAQPVLNIISCTYIGNVFGGGLGEPAKMYANPTVNVNMVTGKFCDDENIGVPKVMTTLNLPSTENTGHLGIIKNVFGGGDAADVEGSTTVNIATEANKGAYITGMVFGGGNNADVKGNTSVNMAGGYVKDRVYGGGKLGNVGTFTRKSKANSGHNHAGNCMGKPDTWTANTGRCVVTVSGGQVGPLGMTMPDDYGYVFGAGRGETADPNVDVDVDFKTYVHDTRVIIKNTYEEGSATANDSLSHITKAPLICGGVYGGSEAGRVGNNTDVRIYGGQIGLGNGKTAAYEETKWTAAVTAVTSGDASSIAAAAQDMPECNSWTYDPTSPHNALPYDVHANDASYNAETMGAASTTGYDGHTFYGNVFGGGSGYFAYTGENVHGWLRSAGLVEGDTHVTISGGHILTSVYGGNELTDVNGKCYVKMTGGTLGVPRTLDQIAAHPVTCYLFGAGKGDQRIYFNTFTNVGAVDVNISGGTIFGSVFGGGEDGHVLGNVDLAVSGGHIGTWGTSYVDGNVFGGGRGFGGDALTAGVVQGNVDVTISNGTVLGSIYGGGRLGSVGTYLVPASHENYGKLIPDGKNQDYKNWDTSDNNFGKPVDATGVTHGHVTINISGGTIGNSYEYVIPTSTDNWTATNWNTWKTDNHIPNTEFGTTDTDKNRLMHTKGGNVFAGAMGRLYALNGSTILTYWADLGKAKQTEVTISGGNIKSNVYGGGELGAVVNGTKVSITGGIVGTEVTSTDAAYTYGSVFGGGYGSDANVTGTYTTVEETSTVSVKDWAGRVKGNTQVEMKSGTTTQGTVKASVYGGGELAWVDGTTQVTVTAGEIGKNELDGQNTKFGGYRMGNVYGGGKGSLDYVKAGLVTGNANVTINGTTTTPKIYHNIYGGGALGSVGTFTYDDNLMPTGMSDASTGTATVKFIGGTVGINGHDNGMLNGSSRGGEGNPNTTQNLDRVAWVKNAVVEIGKNGNNEAENTNASVAIKGAVYGGGENGHNLQDAEISIYGGTIGNAEASTDFDCGNVYGAGCGTDTYTITSGTNTTEHHNPMAGCVRGTTSIKVYGGNVLRNVYGGGAMGSVGGNTAVTGAGKTTINIYGGVIGTTDNSSYGNVYGGPKGDHDETEFYASVRETLVNINAHPTDNTKIGADVRGSVFGGGEAGIVKEKVVVNMNGGEVKQDVYGGGALANTNTDNWGTDTWASGKSSASYTTAVNLTGGKINHNVYGGGLGKMAVGTEPAIEAKVYGNTTVELNNEVDDTARGCIVLGSIFGCNNLSGSPQGTTTVHIYKTQRDGATRITNTDSDKTAKVKGTETNGEYNPGSFDVKAVYGGGNMAAYNPLATITSGTDAEKEASKPAATVIIDGCDRTSICQVYGGGNAASTPATSVTINGTYEIGELFGGGNGKDDIVKNNVTLPNPGANVGYKDYSVYYQEDGVWKVKDNTDADTKANRIAKYQYGSGVATVNVYGGTIHRVFGGSNTKGNVRKTALTLLEEKTSEGKVCCDFKVDEAYGGGKSAAMDADARLLMACIPGLEAVYGGAEAADVQGGVILNITNGTFDRVFGGNNISGTINGSIEVNIEETGCRPIIIGELYGGGNEAGYSIYGYDGVDANGRAILKESGDNPWNDPVVNAKSFTSIGDIFGGGYGSTAIMVGNPTVNVNVASDPTSEAQTKSYKETNSTTQQEETKYYSDFAGETKTIAGHSVTLPPHAKGKMGVVNNVFGGGNAAQVKGDTQVNVGTTTKVYMVVNQELIVGTTDVSSFYTRSGSTYTKCTSGSKAADGVTYYQEYDVLGADIRGNVYGGGNNAEVTGNTNVNIGKKVE